MRSAISDLLSNTCDANRHQSRPREKPSRRRENGKYGHRSGASGCASPSGPCCVCCERRDGQRAEAEARPPRKAVPGARAPLVVAERVARRASNLRRKRSTATRYVTINVHQSNPKGRRARWVQGCPPAPCGGGGGPALGAAKADDLNAPPTAYSLPDGLMAASS